MTKKKYMDLIDDYLTRELGGTFWISELPVDCNDCFRLTLWERLKVLVGVTPEYFPVRIDWEYKGSHFNTVYTGPADKACLEPLATKLYRVYLKEEGIT